MAELAPSLLQFLAADAERLDRFLALTGLTTATIRAASRQPDFAQDLLAYVSSDEAMLLAYAAASGTDAAELATLRRAAAASDE